MLLFVLVYVMALFVAVAMSLRPYISAWVAGRRQQPYRWWMLERTSTGWRPFEAHELPSRPMDARKIEWLPNGVPDVFTPYVEEQNHCHWDGNGWLSGVHVYAPSLEIAKRLGDKMVANWLKR